MLLKDLECSEASLGTINATPELEGVSILWDEGFRRRRILKPEKDSEVWETRSIWRS